MGSTGQILMAAHSSVHPRHLTRQLPLGINATPTSSEATSRRESDRVYGTLAAYVAVTLSRRSGADVTPACRARLVAVHYFP